MGGRSKSMKRFKMHCKGEPIRNEQANKDAVGSGMRNGAVKVCFPRPRTCLEDEIDLCMEVDLVPVTAEVGSTDWPRHSRKIASVNFLIERNSRRKSSVRGRGSGVRKVCTACGTDKTPQWRKGPHGIKTLCNACGVKYKRGPSAPKPHKRRVTRKPEKLMPRRSQPCRRSDEENTSTVPGDRGSRFSEDLTYPANPLTSRAPPSYGNNAPDVMHHPDHIQNEKQSLRVAFPRVPCATNDAQTPMQALPDAHDDGMGSLDCQDNLIHQMPNGCVVSESHFADEDMEDRIVPSLTVNGTNGMEGSSGRTGTNSDCGTLVENVEGEGANEADDVYKVIKSVSGLEGFEMQSVPEPQKEGVLTAIHELSVRQHELASAEAAAEELNKLLEQSRQRTEEVRTLLTDAEQRLKSVIKHAKPAEKESIRVVIANPMAGRHKKSLTPSSKGEQ